jgi:hypothetical protein
MVKIGTAVMLQEHSGVVLLLPDPIVKANPHLGQFISSSPVWLGLLVWRGVVDASYP